MTEQQDFSGIESDNSQSANSRRKRLAAMVAGLLLFGGGVLVAELSMKNGNPINQIEIIQIPSTPNGIPGPLGPTGETAIVPEQAPQI